MKGEIDLRTISPLFSFLKKYCTADEMRGVVEGCRARLAEYGRSFDCEVLDLFAPEGYEPFFDLLYSIQCDWWKKEEDENEQKYEKPDLKRKQFIVSFSPLVWVTLYLWKEEGQTRLLVMDYGKHLESMTAFYSRLFEDFPEVAVYHCNAASISDENSISCVLDATLKLAGVPNFPECFRMLRIEKQFQARLLHDYPYLAFCDDAFLENIRYFNVDKMSGLLSILRQTPSELQEKRIWQHRNAVFFQSWARKTEEPVNATGCICHVM